MNSFPEKPNDGSETAPSPSMDAGPVWPAEPLPGSMAPTDPPWSGWDVLRIMLMAIVAFVLVLAAMSFVVRGANLRHRLNSLNAQPELLIVGQMLAYLLILGYMYLLITRERGQPHFWHAIRWNWPQSIWTYLLLGFLIQAVFLVIERFLPFPKEVPFDAVLKRPYSILLISVFSVTLGPLMEEMFFRGFLYPVVKRRTGVALAVVATAFPFALMHAAQYGNSWASVLLIFVVGVVLAAVREKKDSLAASFLVHVGYNGTIMLLLFVGTGGFRHLERLNQ